jgi:hypothetical protein
VENGVGTSVIHSRSRELSRIASHDVMNASRVICTCVCRVVKAGDRRSGSLGRGLVRDRSRMLYRLSVAGEEACRGNVQSLRVVMSIAEVRIVTLKFDLSIILFSSCSCKLSFATQSASLPAKSHCLNLRGLRILETGSSEHPSRSSGCITLPLFEFMHICSVTLLSPPFCS